MIREVGVELALSANMTDSTSTVTTGDRSGIEVNTPRTFMDQLSSAMRA